MVADFLTELLFLLVRLDAKAIRAIQWRNPVTWFAIISLVAGLLAWVAPHPYDYVFAAIGVLNLLATRRWWRRRTRTTPRS